MSAGVKERPIIFCAEMVRAILDSRKTQTRQIIRDQPPSNCVHLSVAPPGDYLDGRKRWAWTDGASVDYAWHPWIGDEPAWQTFPLGDKGGRLWAKETWEWTFRRDRFRIVYEADRSERITGAPGDYMPPKAALNPCRWVKPLFMPRWASRITLEITDVRVERVQDISEDDALAEGCEREFKPDGSDYGAGLIYAADNFRKLWDSINAKRGYGWDKNPWVWVLTFKVVKP